MSLGSLPPRPRSERIAGCCKQAADMMAKMKPGDKLVIERHEDEPSKNLYTVTVKTNR